MSRAVSNSSVAVVLLCAAVTAPANAADPGFYVTASLGQGKEDPKSRGTNVANSQGVFHVDPQSVDVDTGSTSWSAGLGYRINKYLSGEVEFVEFGSTRVVEHYSVPNPAPLPFPTDFDLDYTSKVTGPVLSVLGTLPVGRNVELHLRGGALFASREFRVNNYASNEVKFASTVWLAGAGVTWSPTRRWGIRAEYEQSGKLDTTAATGENELKRISLSALFRF